MIDESYEQYISIFYSGSITVRDQNFVLSILNRDPKPFDYRLNNPSSVVKKLNPMHFQQTAAKNYYLLEYLLTTNQNNLATEIIKNVVSDDNSNLRFIDQFSTLTESKNKFFEILGKNWSSLWEKICKAPDYSEEKKNNYLIWIIQYCSVDDICKMDISNDISQYLSKSDCLLSIIDSVGNIEKIRLLFEKISIKAELLKVQQLNKANVDLLLDTKSYAITVNVINSLLNWIDDKLIQPNYTAIMQSNEQRLIKYIQDNINVFVKEILLTLVKDNEDETIYIELLHNSDLNISLKEKVIEIQTTVIQDIKKTPKELWGILIKNHKVTINIYTILDYFNEFGVDQCLIDFMNNSNNITNNLLYKKDDFVGEYREILEKFSEAIISNDHFSIDSYELLINKIIVKKSYDLPDVKPDYLRLLITNSCIACNDENYLKLKEHDKNLHLMLLERNQEYIDNVELNSNEAFYLFQSKMVSTDKKQVVLNQLTWEEIYNDLDLFNIIEKLWCMEKIRIPYGLLSEMFDDAEFMAKIDSKALVFRIFTFELASYENDQQNDLVDKAIELNLIDTFDKLFKVNHLEIKLDYKLQMLISMIEKLRPDELQKALIQIGPDYSNILVTSSQSKLADNQYNEVLLDKLKRMNLISSYKEDQGVYRIYKKRKKGRNK